MSSNLKGGIFVLCAVLYLYKVMYLVPNNRALMRLGRGADREIDYA